MSAPYRTILNQIRRSFPQPIVALKAYILSLFVDEGHVERRVTKVLEARLRMGAPAGKRTDVS